MKVKIPFKAQFRDAMLNGKKTMTSRTRMMGRIGDTFDAFGQTFRITAVNDMLLKDVVKFWRFEGCKSHEDFIDVWKSIHPRKGFDPNQAVWLHEFSLVKVSLAHKRKVQGD